MRWDGMGLLIGFMCLVQDRGVRGGLGYPDWIGAQPVGELAG